MAKNEQGQLRDPAETIRQAKQAEDNIGSVRSMDDLTFVPIPRSRARASSPFDGYPFKPKVEIGQDKGKPVMVSASYIVAVAPSVKKPDDPSGQGVSIMSRGQEKIVNLPSYHSRTFVDHDRGGATTEVVFDREWVQGGTRLQYAIVTSHAVRSQLMYLYNDRSRRIETDTRYIWPDPDQASRLRKLFEMILNPKIRVEQLASIVAGETNGSDSDLEALPTGA